MKLLGQNTKSWLGSIQSKFDVSGSRQWPEVCDWCHIFRTMCKPKKTLFPRDFRTRIGFFGSHVVQKRVTKSDTLGHCLDGSGADSSISNLEPECGIFHWKLDTTDARKYCIKQKDYHCIPTLLTKRPSRQAYRSECQCEFLCGLWHHSHLAELEQQYQFGGLVLRTKPPKMTITTGVRSSAGLPVA